MSETEKLKARRDALIQRAREVETEIRRKKSQETAQRRQTLRYAVAVLGGYVAYQADAGQRAELIAAAVMSEKKKRAREALELLASAGAVS